jgi:hypothetical protein
LDRLRRRILHLLNLASAIYQVLLDIADRELHFEIVLVGFGDLVQPEKNRFKPGQVGDLIDLLSSSNGFMFSGPTMLSYTSL